MMALIETPLAVVNDIPRYVPSNNYARDFGEQWNLFPKTQLDSHSGLPISERRLARCFRGELDKIAGKLVLEAGSGAGRFTEILLKAGATVHSFDYSNAVEANKLNNGDNSRLTLVQADIRQIPFAPARYDYVVCLGVVQHTPSPEETIAQLWKMVKPGGRLIFDHYRYRRRYVLPPPFGDSVILYRWFTLRLPHHRRFPFIRRVVDFWFPIHWRLRDSLLAQRLLRRFSPVYFYYPDLQLGDRQIYYEWALLDTHDATTDYYKHLRRPDQIKRTLEDLGAENIEVTLGGNGVEAACTKPV
jgi:SAM-dependent methyltransferase